MYKFISYDEYLSSDYSTLHPNARVNLEQTEVVLSCSTHHDCSCLTHEQAMEYITENWQIPEIV